MAWRDVHVGEPNSRFTLEGVEVWREEWRWLDARTIYLPNPLQPADRHRFMVCEAGSRRRPVRFAAGELPGNIWAFYVEE